MVGARRVMLGAWLAAALSLGAQPLPAWRVGDIAQADVVTPVTLVVLEPAASESGGAGSGQASPLIARFNLGAAVEAEGAFVAAVSSLRSNFLAAMKSAYPLTKVTARNLTSKRFLQLTNQFQQQHEGFPLEGDLVRTWALGLDDDPVFQPLADKLRVVMLRPLLPDALPADVRTGDRVQLLCLAEGEAATPAELGPAALLASRASLVTVAHAREAFMESFPPEQRPMAAYAAGFLRENCAVETVPTPPSRTSPSDALYVAHRYEAGEAIVKRGQVIDSRTLAALAQLREKLAVGELQQQVAAAQSVARHVSRQNWWLLGGVVGLAGLVAVLGLWVSHRRQLISRLPVRVAEADHLLLSPDDAPLISQESGGESASLRAGFAAQLARWTGSRLVQRLLSQRSRMIEVQHEAAEEMAELAKRLEAVQTPLRERLQAYEGRIAELEKQLAKKGAENRELIKAKIDLTRRQLAAERERNQVELN